MLERLCKDTATVAEGTHVSVVEEGQGLSDVVQPEYAVCGRPEPVHLQGETSSHISLLG